MSHMYNRVRPAALALIVLALPCMANAAPEESDLERANAIVEAYAQRFRVIDSRVAENLEALYAEDVRLRDPITTVEGLDALRAYFEHFAEQSKGARFEITASILAPDRAAVFWTMVRPNGGDDAHRIEGVSHLEFGDRIHRQRDYFDLGAAVYERVPVLGSLTRFVKRRLEPETPAR